MEGLSKRELHCFAMCRFVICATETNRGLAIRVFFFFFPTRQN